MYANAGASGYGSTDTQDPKQTSEVTVTLQGAERQGVVQIVGYLLGRLPEVVEKREGELRIVPGKKGACVARWQLTVHGISGIGLDSKFMATINSLDLKGNNAIFYESPFIIVPQDLEMVKQIKSLRSSVNYAVFSLLPGDSDSLAVLHRQQQTFDDSRNPWLLIPGAGFE